MDLINRMIELNKTKPLISIPKLKIVYKDGDTVEGYYASLIPAVDNEPEINQLDIKDKYGNYIGINEDEIETIDFVDN